ncbi:hypothetical protein ILUMI_08639 [Ignelater luminosus]|uniref:HTH CENPB-type domain-containing protein n=1 Tax=Ignelater luminosus TaxID=2038154 RepID=A0A8K0D5C1_IGNLU|nr:hypothetical protein ILUMI_08639 [Ignelater luminosus]
MAGKEWLTMFLKRNPELSIRKLKPTSFGRATSFNAQNVKVFFDKLAEVMDKYHFTASQIWNADETGVSTVLKPNKIVAAKGKRNVGAMTSGERGTNVTMVTAVSASGNTVPPIDDEFSLSFVTDRPDPESVQLEKNPSGPAVMHAREPDSVTASTSQAEEEAGTATKKTYSSIHLGDLFLKLFDHTQRQSSEESNEDDYAWLVCCEACSESLPGEKWIQCQVCKEWAHTKCAPNAGLSYVCINCDSNNDE